MVDIFGMTLEVISRPFYIELLQSRHFVAFLYLLLDICTSSLQIKFDRIFPVTLRSLQGHLS